MFTAPLNFGVYTCESCHTVHEIYTPEQSRVCPTCNAETILSRQMDNVERLGAKSFPEHRCEYIVSYVGRCKEMSDAVGFCDKHRDLRCVECKGKATCDCDHTGQFVCGAPLCDKCKHTDHRGFR